MAREFANTEALLATCTSIICGGLIEASDGQVRSLPLYVLNCVELLRKGSRSLVAAEAWLGRVRQVIVDLLRDSSGR